MTGVDEEAVGFKPTQLGTEGGGTAMPAPELQKNKDKDKEIEYIVCLVLRSIKHQTHYVLKP